MKLYFEWNTDHAFFRDGGWWYWTVDEDDHTWKITPDDATDGTLVWLRGYVK